MEVSSFSIAAVERETGLSKDVLRVWERRYGFPIPLRDAHGERLYPPEQVERLRLIKRLMDLGHRPGKLIAADPQALQAQWAMARPPVSAPAAKTEHEPGLDGLLALIQQRDLAGYEQALQQQLARLGLQHFVHDVVAPLAQRVGLAWEEGRLEVFEEHLFTELTKRALRQAVAVLPRSSGTPRVVLTSVPGEQHILGLLMVEALLSLEGAECVPLGPKCPWLKSAAPPRRTAPMSWPCRFQPLTHHARYRHCSSSCVRCCRRRWLCGLAGVVSGVSSRWQA